MPEKRPDRRTLKTRKALCDALAELLAEKELEKVTVREIADKADVNRVTFYKHYLDVYDLYDKIEQEVLVEMGMLMLRLEELPADRFFSDLLDYIDGNRTVFRLIFSPNCPSRLRSRFNKLAEGVFLKTGAERYDKYDTTLTDTDLEYRSRYRSYGCISVIERWVNGGFDISKADLAAMLSELDRSIAIGKAV